MESPLPEFTVRRSTIILLSLLAGCTTWHPVPLPAPEQATWEAGGRVRITTADGKRFVADTLRFTADSATAIQVRPGSTNTLSRAAVLRVDQRKVDGGVTALLGVAILGAVVIALIGVGNSFSGGLGY